MGNNPRTDEFFEALGALTEVERLGLMAAARRLASGHSGFTGGDDLLGEAIHRFVDGRRNWPEGLSLATFLANAMRSIVNTTRQRKEMATNREVWDDDARWIVGGACARMSALDEALASERQRLGEKAFDFARRTLSGDKDGLAIVEGMAADLSPADMREAFGIDEVRFHAARQRVMSRLDIWSKRHPQ